MSQTLVLFPLKLVSWLWTFIGVVVGALKMWVLLHLVIKDSDLVKHPFRLRANIRELMLCCGWEFSTLNTVSLALYLLDFPEMTHAGLLDSSEDNAVREWS